MSKRDDDIPLLFRGDGSVIPQKKNSGLNVYLNEATRMLSINGVQFSVELLLTLAPSDETARGPFWVKREGNEVAIYEMDAEALADANATESN